MSTIKQRVREYAMSHDEILHRAARRSLLSVLVTAGFVTVNHLYPLGAKALLLGALLAGGATALLWWFRNSRRSAVADRKSTRLNSSHDQISYAVFCLKKKK